MGLLTDILKEIPQAAVLKEKIADIEAKYAASDTENAILKDDNRELKTEIAKLKQQIAELTHKDNALPDLQIRLLIALGSQDAITYSDALAAAFHEHRTRIQYHVEELQNAGYVQSPPPIIAGPASYYLTQKGREYLVKNDLL